jgi:hypothetical protein
MVPDLSHELLTHRKSGKILSLFLESAGLRKGRLTLRLLQVGGELRIGLVVLLVHLLALLAEIRFIFDTHQVA